MEFDLTVAEIHARIRWARMCLALMLLQDDFRMACERAAAAPRKSPRW